ncbi:2-succinyl-6-hydroxy-2, 4-cyclohexadiene-1-carboxylate synthase [Jeotgalicoccus saudimassiliensis]|uniref:2-succinyl-6-hydroxy-2, 4-cyclohexadiene-1-carboxylate synthase n=1 Tax=Jeotgalicoccus saudimassiliensis TaxID=1461582 RepID=A0A078M8U8_9STAP|nr:alpha/beta hydrolase [Jeotgalicoccus saudimassiliensis]CEA03863.1 2-succinyl-6-hydroxy-2, 4-cyclohexadiene-1-carboxylate synthase [Jeotgalicoccus saudimassiliensis]
MTERIQVKDKNININKTGDGKNGTLLIFIHGLTGNYLQMHHFQEYFKNSFDTLSYDLSGRGDSTLQSEPAGIHQHTEDLLGLIDTLDYGNFILTGYSMGGYIALDAARRSDRISKVVLLDGGGVADEDTSNLVIPSLGRLEKSFDSADDYLDMMRQSYGSLGVEWSGVMDRVIAHEIHESGGSVQAKSDYTLTKQDFASFYDYPHSEIYKNVNVPVLLIICTGPIKNNTPLFNKDGYSLMLDTVKNIRSSDYALNHYEIVFNNNPDLNREINEFLELE